MLEENEIHRFHVKSAKTKSFPSVYIDMEIVLTKDTMTHANREVWESLKREFNEPFNQQYMASQIIRLQEIQFTFRG